MSALDNSPCKGIYANLGADQNIAWYSKRGNIWSRHINNKEQIMKIKDNLHAENRGAHMYIMYSQEFYDS